MGRTEVLVPRSASKFLSLSRGVSSTSRDLVILRRELQWGCFSLLFILVNHEFNNVASKSVTNILCPHMRPANKLETEFVLCSNLQHFYFSNISELRDDYLWRNCFGNAAARSLSWLLRLVIETCESVVSHRGRFQSVCGRKGINFKLGSKTALLFTWPGLCSSMLEWIALTSPLK